MSIRNKLPAIALAAAALVVPNHNAFAKQPGQELSCADKQYVRTQAGITYRELRQGGIVAVRLDQRDGTVKTLTPKSSLNQITAAYMTSANVEKRVEAHNASQSPENQDDGKHYLLAEVLQVFAHPVRAMHALGARPTVVASDTCDLY